MHDLNSFLLLIFIVELVKLVYDQNLILRDIDLYINQLTEGKIINANAECS